MNKSLINRAISFLWTMFRFNLLFAASNIVLIVALLGFVLHWSTLPLYLLGIFLLVPSLQALFLAIKRREELFKVSPTKLYIRCYREEFNGALLFAAAYIVAALLLLGSYLGLVFMPAGLTFISLYALLGIMLYIHFVFGLLIRANFVIKIGPTWRLGFYCISRYPLKSFFILGGTFIAGALVNTFHQLMLLGIVPIAIYILTISTEKMFKDIAIILKLTDNEEEGLNEGKDDSK